MSFRKKMLKEKRYHVTKHKSISVVKHIAEIIVVLNFKLRKPLFSTNYQKKPNKTKKNKRQGEQFKYLA